MAVGDKIVTLDGLKAVHDYTQRQMDDMELLTYTAKYTERQGYIMATTRKWGAVNAKYTHVLIPLVSGDSVTIKTGGKGMYYALLTSDAAPVQGNDPPFSTGEDFMVNGNPSQLEIGVNATASFTVPEETGVTTHYLLIYTKWNEAAYQGANALKSLTINGVELATKSSVRLKAVEDKVSAMDVYVKPDCVYVDGSAAATGDGTSASPFKTIQEGVNSGAEIVRVKALSNGGYAPFSVQNRVKPLKIMLWEMGTYAASEPDGTVAVPAPKILITGSTSYGVMINRCADVELSDIWVDHVPTNCYNILDVGRIVCTRCYASYNTDESASPHGFRVVNTNGVFRDCVAEHIVMDGFNIHGFGDTQFINCVADFCGDDGISHHDSCTGLILGGEYSNCGKGGVASPTFGASVDVIGVYSHDNHYGLYALSTVDRALSAGRVSGCTFKDNTVKDVRVEYADVTAWNVIYDTKAVAYGTFTEMSDISHTGIGSPADIQRLAQRGIAGETLEIGQIIYAPWTDTRGDTPVVYQAPLQVVHIGQVTDGDGNVHDGAVYLQWAYAVPGTVLYGHDTTGQTNRYMNCSLREWLNGDFFSGFAPDWRAVFGTVKVKTAVGNENASSASDLSYDVTNDKVFLPGLVQMGGVPQSSFSGLDEGVVFDYWKGKLDGSPTNNADDDRIVTNLTDPDGSAGTVFLRTPSLKSTVNNYYVSTAGALTAGSVTTASGRFICPVCVIY